MAFKPITNPRGVIIRGKNGKAELIWNAGCAPRMNEMLSKKQEIIDSEVLRLCAPMVPKRTGALERSGTLGTVIGSGEVQYIQNRLSFPAASAGKAEKSNNRFCQGWCLYTDV